MEPLGGLGNHPTAACSGWATLLDGHRGVHHNWTLLVLVHVRPREGPPFSLNPLSLQLFSQTGELQPASTLSKSLFFHVCTHSFISVFVRVFIYSFLDSCIHFSSCVLNKFLP